jgi:hypothetical protein
VVVQHPDQPVASPRGLLDGLVREIPDDQCGFVERAEYKLVFHSSRFSLRLPQLRDPALDGLTAMFRFANKTV